MNTFSFYLPKWLCTSRISPFLFFLVTGRLIKKRMGRNKVRIENNYFLYLVGNKLHLTTPTFNVN